MAIPAEGPSFGTAPAGTWMWMSCSANHFSPRSGATRSVWPRTKVSAACADSRITSPICPVMVREPEPGTAEASTNSTSPPAGVQASPVATPGSLVRRRCSAKYLRLPSSSRAFLAEIVVLPRDLPSATRAATFLQIAPISRSRLLTPASRVYSLITASRPASANSSFDLVSPLALSCRGTR